MDFNTVQQLITTLGFPIVCVLGLSWFVYKVWKDSREDMKQQMQRLEQDSKERENKLYEQIDKFGESLNSFNATLIKIDTRLDYLEKEYRKEE